MTTPFLILHKVRGEPAFDIAIPCAIGDEEGWIIPTSGHRAYPYWHALLAEIVYGNPFPTPPIPVDWPDHYSCNDTFSIQAESLGTAQALLAKLGLGSKPIKRRRID